MKAVPPFMLTTLSPRADVTLTLSSLRPFSYQYIPIARRRIWEFRLIDKGADYTRPPGEWRHIALIWTTEGSDTFTLQYYPYKETPQIVQSLPLSALAQAVSDLRAAGF